MRRVQIQLSDAQAVALKDIASRLERPVASVIREAVDAWIDQEERGRRIEGAFAAIGGHGSGSGDLPENHDRYLNAGDLVSISEIAQRAGRSINTIQSWRRRYKRFPKPFTQLAAGPIWDWDEVAGWISSRSRGEGRSERALESAARARLPGMELVRRGLADVAAGRESVEGMLVRSATAKLAAVGINVPGGRLDDATSRLYALVVEQVGEGRAHSRYNALRRRLSSFVRASERVDGEALKVAVEQLAVPT
jgi:hypothetical protein